MQKEFFLTPARKELQDQDKLGSTESYEARIRGALSPYWFLVSLIKMLEDGHMTEEKFVQQMKDQLEKHTILHQPNLLELLKSSEEDRLELFLKIEGLDGALDIAVKEHCKAYMEKESMYTEDQVREMLLAVLAKTNVLGYQNHLVKKSSVAQIMERYEIKDSTVAPEADTEE